MQKVSDADHMFKLFAFINPAAAAAAAGSDGGRGFIPETFVVTQPAMHGGTACSASHGAVR
jgi:hypothetical protein